MKPQNILLDQQGRVYLADFGIARMVEGGAAITRTGLVSGTPQYMAPEQATGQALDHRMDIYALGIVAYEMFTGSTPFSADTPVAVLMKQVSSPIPIPPKEDVPEALLGPLIKSLAKNPDERWETAEGFASAIEKGLGLVATAVASDPAPTAVLSRTQSLSPEPPPPTVGTPTARVPPPLPPRRGVAAPPRRAGAGALALWIGLAFAALLAAAAAVAFWVWQRPQAPPDLSTVATSSPEATPATPTPPRKPWSPPRSRRRDRRPRRPPRPRPSRRATALPCPGWLATRPRPPRPRRSRPH